MARRIGGQNFEGQYFIIAVPSGWVLGDPLPAPSPDDRWFTRIEDFKAALDCPWARRPLRHVKWKPIEASRGSGSRSTRQAPNDRQT